jgi:spermidine/putrescine transport system ATP-binding protein
MALLEFNSVTKEYGDLVAVNDCSFEVFDGEFVSILGPSGSGKSTMLRMISGFEQPTSGSIRLENEDLADVPPFERETNMVFQDLALFPHLTVAENIEYGLNNKDDLSKEEREAKIEEMLEMVQLGGYGDRNPKELSGGEQQRVALVRALVNEPAMVLFDEPLASLDRQLRQHMQVELQRIQDKTDTTFLYVTHDQEVAMATSDRMILLRDGEIEQIGSARELYEEPASQFVANFIGDVNTMLATVRNVSDSVIDLTTQVGDLEVSLSPDTLYDDVDVTTGDVVNLCVRPHDVTVADEAPSTEFSTSGQIENRIYKGNDVRYMLDTPVGDFTIDSDTAEFEIGDSVHAMWSRTDAHIFISEKDGTTNTGAQQSATAVEQ